MPSVRPRGRPEPFAATPTEAGAGAAAAKRAGSAPLGAGDYRRKVKRSLIPCLSARNDFPAYRAGATARAASRSSTSSVKSNGTCSGSAGLWNWL